jgi:sulfatase maturation enzyme AslB (radical SAM superfamily)
MSPTATNSGAKKTCQVCGKAASKKCSRCHLVWYCSEICQKKGWKAHKSLCNSEYQTHQYELHKKAFDTIIDKYNLKTAEKSNEISDILTNGTDSVSAEEFAEKFSMDIKDAVVFLEWIKVGIDFKVTTSKNAGFGAAAAALAK